MREYKRPEFYVTEFAANEYVAVCEDTTIGASCEGSGGTVTLRIDSDQGKGSYTATPVDSNGNMAGNSGMLYPYEKGYVFAGPITGHNPVNGEFYPVGQVAAAGFKVGDSYSSGTVCSCNPTNSGNSVGTWHHHLMTSQVVSS